jgi:hypothetical protein
VNDVVVKKGIRDREAWWVWRWDRTDAENVEIPFTSITRWRRGSFLTVYRMETPGDVTVTGRLHDARRLG